MNALEFFNLHRPMIEAAIVATWRQGRQSALPPRGRITQCCYLSDNGDRCAIGHMKPPQFWIDLELQKSQKTVGSLPSRCLNEIFPDYEDKLDPDSHAAFFSILRCIQRAHDDASPDHFSSDFAAGISLTYRVWELGTSPLEGITE